MNTSLPANAENLKTVRESQVESRHTPGPFVLARFNRDMNTGYRYFLHAGGTTHGWSIAHICNHDDAEANAAFMVQAMNSHEALVAQLKTMTDAYAKAMKDAGVTHYPEALAVVREARAALKSATP
jgi:hypothetical protein